MYMYFPTNENVMCKINYNLYYIVNKLIFITHSLVHIHISTLSIGLEFIKCQRENLPMSLPLTVNPKTK